MATNTITAEQQELLAMLMGELQGQLELSLAGGTTESEQLQSTAEALDNFANAAELIGLEGLVVAWRCLRDNFYALAKEGVTDGQQLLVDSWIIYFLDLLQQLMNAAVASETVKALTAFLASECWPLPLRGQASEDLAVQLQKAQVAVMEESVNQLPVMADATMLTLIPGEQINPDLFEGLMIELPGQVTQFAQYLNEFIQRNEPESLAAAQRIAHTLKGAGNVVGISGLANFMHFSEDLLEEISRHQEPLTRVLQQLLLDMSDTLATMLDSLIEGTQGDVADQLMILQRVLDAYHGIRGNDLAAYAPPDIPIQPVTALSQMPPAASEVETPVANLQESLAAHLRIKEDTAQDLLRLAGESAISTNRLQTQVQDVKAQLHHIGQLHNKLTHLTEEFGYLIEVRELFNAQSKVRGDLHASALDPLELDRYNELHSFFHQLQEFAVDTRDAIYQTQGQLRALEDLTYEQQVTNRASQSHLLEMRMIPASHFSSRFERCIRQACRLTGKHADFVLSGGETMIDSRLLNKLVDPLMHLLRNAVDHGIEAAEERGQRGKPPQGNIELSFTLQGQAILVRVRDDGAGLDLARIAQKAQDLGLTPPAGPDTDAGKQWLKHIIFAAGFSTRDQVSQTSGRGIGLDMVADRLAEMKGRINVDSQPQLGCEFTLRLPMPMIAEQGLLVASGKHRLAIAARGVEQLLFLEEDALTNQGEHLRYQFNQQEIEVFHLAQLARLPDALAISTMDAHALLVVETNAGQLVGVLVERVIASREMVVKPLTAFTPHISGVLGATILGDGDVAPVLDVQQLVGDMLGAGAGALDWMQQSMRISQQSVADKPMALIVDDSLSTRRSLAQFVGDMGMDVYTAKDGFEAIEFMQEQTPSIILVDMEMPRMNGLELTAHVRANDTTRHIPVIMITSRNTEKHRNLAAAAGVNTYLNKPFSEEELLHHIQDSMQLSQVQGYDGR